MRRAFVILGLLLAPFGVVLAQSGLDRVAGKALFERLWVPAPASTDASDGLGPLFSERSCAACHSGPGDGASVAFAPDGLRVSGLAVRFGDGGGRPDPIYGRNLQIRAIPNLPGEGNLAITGEPGGPLAFRFTPGRGPLAPATRLSYRLAPPLIARISRIEEVAEGAILTLADPDDRDGDGISGKINWIDAPGGRKIGRFGWKAEQPDLAHQIADAFAIDIGISSPLVPRPNGDCTAAERDCLAKPNGRSAAFDGEEISAAMVELVAGYVRGLEPPARPAPDGGDVFAAIGCVSCHVRSLPGRDGSTVTLFSDLLLHDLGPAFDDGVGAPGVVPSEWRTPPLAGLSWSNGPTRRYLHDGRWPTLDAAIRAHGGEAARAVQRYAGLPESERARLIAFLEGL